MIIICEPVCIGFEHAEFNSTFIKTVKMAFKGKIIFLGEETHLKHVKNIMGAEHGIIYKVIDVPHREQSRMGRFGREFRLTRELFTQASSNQADFVIFTTITSSALASVKIWLRRFKDLRVLVVPHSELDFITHIPLSRDLIFWFKWWLKYFNHSHLKYILLGKALKDELINELPGLTDYTEYIDLPLIFKNFETSSLSSQGLKFGFLGVGSVRKGFGDFIKLSKEIKAKYPEKIVSFILVGSVIDTNIKVLGDSIEIAAQSPLKAEDYYHLVNEMNYVIFLHKPEYYRFTASGVFTDAISCLKPVIAIKNPFIEYYFDLMGDIGYLCQDYQEIRSVVEEIVKNPDPKRYKEQQLNIIQGREKFSLEKQADKIKKIFNNFK